MPKKGRGKGEELDPLKLPLRLQTALQALYGHYEKTFKLWQEKGIKVPPCFIVVCQNTAISKLVYDFISGFQRKNADGTTTLENGRLALFRNFDETTGNPLPRPNTLLIDSEQLEAGDALDDNFRGMAADEIERFRREIVERTGDAQAGENITDQELLREVMNTVGKPGQLGGSIRCVVSVSMLTEGWDANTVTHILGIRAFGTQLLCEQVIGRALRRQSYELNEEGADKGLFNVEYADIFGIPFDFTAKPVLPPPQPPRETVQVKAMRPERDALEIRFPRVEGYRVELPEERLTADFNDDSILELSPEIVGPSITRNSGIIGEGVDMSLKHLGDMRPSPACLQRHSAAALHQMARPRRGAEATPVRPTQAHHQAMARHVPRLQGRDLSGAADVSGTGRHGVQPHHGGHHPAVPWRASDQGAARSIQSNRFDPTRPIQHVAGRSLGHERSAAEEPSQLGRARQRLGRRILPRRRISPACRSPTPRTITSDSKSRTATARRCGCIGRISSCWSMMAMATDDPLHLVVEIKGYRREDAKEKKSTMETYWVPGVNHLGTYGRWAFAEFTEVYQIESDFKAKWRASSTK